MDITREKLDEMSVEELIEKAMNDVKELPRHERRRYEKNLKEHAKIVKSFNPAQMKFIDSLVEERSSLKANQEMEKYNVMMDRCISAFLGMEFEELSLDDICLKEDIIAGLIVDDLKKFDERLKKYKGDINMANKKLEKYEDQIRVACEELIASGETQKNAITILQDKFPTLSKSMIINAYKKVKEMLKETALEVATTQIETLEDGNIKEIAKSAAEYIFEEDEEVKEEIECQDPIPQSKLKIKSMTVEGENGVYVVLENGIKGELGKNTYSFRDLEHLKAYKQAKIEEINKITDEFEAVFAIMK